MFFMKLIGLAFVSTVCALYIRDIKSVCISLQFLTKPPCVIYIAKIVYLDIAAPENLEISLWFFFANQTHLSNLLQFLFQLQTCIKAKS